MEEKKVFGYPTFDEEGIKILTAYDGAYRDMLMDVRVYRMKKGEKRTFFGKEEEIAVLLQKGIITLKWEGYEQEASRKDVFTEEPWCLHVSKDIEVEVEAHSDVEILVQCTKNDGVFDSKIYRPQDSPWVYSGKELFGNTANRRVNTIFDYKSAPYSNMVLGEVLNDRGNWSGYIPHNHPQPEIYHFLFDRPEGFGASFVGEDVYKITNGSFSALPGGKTHPQVTAPGYEMYTCWMIRHLDGNPWVDRIDDPRYTWLYDAKF